MVERRLAKANVASSNLVFRSKTCGADAPPIWRHSQVVRQRSAKPSFPSSSLGGASTSPQAIYSLRRFFIKKSLAHSCHCASFPEKSHAVPALPWLADRKGISISEAFASGKLSHPISQFTLVGCSIFVPASKYPYRMTLSTSQRTSRQSSLLFPTKARSLRSLTPLRSPIFQASRFVSKRSMLGKHLG